MSYLGANIRKKKQVGPFAAKKVKAVVVITKRVCQNTLFITEDRYIAELSYKVAI